MQMWVDERGNKKVFFVYRGHVLVMPSPRTLLNLVAVRFSESELVIAESAIIIVCSDEQYLCRRGGEYNKWHLLQ